MRKRFLFYCFPEHPVVEGGEGAMTPFRPGNSLIMKTITLVVVIQNLLAQKRLKGPGRSCD